MTIVARALKFRAKPIEFEAVLFDGSNAEDVIVTYLRICCQTRRICPVAFDHHPGRRKARRQGRLDHQGAFGVFYPLKPDLFETKFEPVEPFGHEEAQPSSA